MKDIPGFEGLYAITKGGKVWSYPKKWHVGPYKKGNSQHNGRWLYKGVNKIGYEYTRIKIYGKGKNYLTHRLLALTYISNQEKKPQINHKNGIKHDNRLSNLEWCTQKENNNHARKTGLLIQARGERIGSSKLICEAVKEIRQLSASGVSNLELARQFRIDDSQISRIKNRKTWAHI